MVSVAGLWKRSAQEQGPLFNVSDPATLPILEDVLLDARAVQYGILVALVICIYDYMLTIGDEVELFWTNMDYKFARILYLVSRGYTSAAYCLPRFSVSSFNLCTESHGIYFIHVQNTTKSCKADMMIVSIFGVVQIIASTLVFGLRIYTIYHRYKSFQRAMVTFFGLCSMVLIVLIAFGCQKIGEAGMWSTLFEACIASPSKSLPGVFLTSTASESHVVGILNSIYLQGGLYYLVIVAGRATNTFILWFATESLFLVNIHIEYALTSVITTRWCLILRATVNQTTVNKTSTLRSHQSYPRQSYHAPISPGGARPLTSIPVRTRGGREDRQRQIINASVHFANGGNNSGYLDSKPYSYNDKTNGYPNDHMRSIHELELGLIDENGLSLSPLNTRSERNLGDAMADAKDAKDLPNTASVRPSSAGVGDKETDGKATGAPVYESRSGSTSSAMVGVQANIVSTVV